MCFALLASLTFPFEGRVSSRMQCFWPLMIYKFGVDKPSIVSGYHHWRDELHALVELYSYDEQVHRHYILSTSQCTLVASCHLESALERTWNL